MKSTILLACVIFFCACHKKIDSLSLTISNDANAYDAIVETALPVHKAIYTTIGTDVKSGYWETLPSLYYKTTKTYPLIIFNHGIGENQYQPNGVTRSLAGVNCCGLPYHIKGGTFPANFGGTSFIVISPQYYKRPNATQVQEVVQYAINKYRVDLNRIYVVGLSQGGGVTMDWSRYYGEKAAAIFPSCPGLYPTDAAAQGIATKNLPIWWTYGTGDNIVPPSQGYSWQNLIDRYNPSYAPHTKLTVWDGLSHNGTWGKAFNPLTKVDGKNAYEWLLQYSRATPGAPVAITSADRVIPVSWNYMPTVWGTQSYDTDGGWIAKFNWRQISGGTCAISAPNSGSTKITGLVLGTYVFRLTVTDNTGKIGTDDIKITMTN